MALLTGLVLSDDELFRRQTAEVLRSGATPVTVTSGPAEAGHYVQEGVGAGFIRPDMTVGAPPDLVVVDGRHQQAAALAAIERLRAAAPGLSIFMVALDASSDVIIRAMRAGANEFLTWPPAEAPFHEAIARAAVRRDALPAARSRATTVAFFGAKGGAGTTTIAVNSAVELARLSKRPTVIVDLKAGLGEVTLFLGVRSRYSLLDAIDNLHRLDGEFLKELVVKHKSGLEILAGSDHFDRPGAADSGAIEEVFRLLGRQYEHILVDAGCHLNACSTAVLYAADTIYLVPNPDVPSIRNAQRLLDRIGHLGACGERVRVVLNRASEPYPIAPDQIEAALGRPIEHRFRSDYRTVSAALNSGVPLSLSGNTELAAQFGAFIQRMVDPSAEPVTPDRRSTLGLQRLASIW